jgi:Ca2+-dependent lipid-binding protein
MARKENLLQFVNSDEESMEWFNQLLYRYWQALEPSLSAQLKESISTILDGLKVSGLDEIRLTKFTLGSQPPRIESVKTFPSTDDEVIVYDFDIVFAPFDEDEVSKKEMQMKELRNLEIVLQIKIAMVPLPVSLKEIMIEGKLRVQMTFMATFPHIKVIDLGFVSSPTIDFILKPLGADLKKIAGVGSLIKDIINTQLAGIIVNPSKFSLPLGEMMGGSGETNTEMPVGVMRVAIYEAKGLKNIDVTGINIGLLCRYIRSCSFNVSWRCRDTKNKNHR